MILLFKEETFSEEFRELLGFVDADISFRSIKSDLTSATREIIKLIGQTTYDRWVTLFEKENRSAEEEEQLHLMRYPIAMNTYRLVAPSKDLQHTNQGRMMRTDDHQARPFQWMINANNAANERKYYRAVDELLEFLFEDPTFRQTVEYKEVKKYFVSTTSDFEEYFSIHSRLILVKLGPGFRQAQRKHLKPVLGVELYNEIEKAHLEGPAAGEELPVLLPISFGETPTSEQKKIYFEIYDLVKEFCVYWSLHWAMPRLSVNLLPEGILQRYTSERETTQASKVPEGLQAQHASSLFKQDAMTALSEIESLVTALYPPVVDPHQEEEDDGFRLFNGDDKFVST